MIEKIKQFLGLEEVQKQPTNDATSKWKALAIELNNELQAERRVKNSLAEEVHRLQAIVDCQGELLAERGAQ